MPVHVPQEVAVTFAPPHDGSPRPASPELAVPAGDGAFVRVPLGQAMFGADFARSGGDLLIDAGEAGTLVVVGYFDRPDPPGLATPEGAVLMPDLVARLVKAGTPVQFAQSEPQSGATDAGGPPAVGEIVELDGGASATRTDGRFDTLAKGDAIFMGDLLETDAGSSLGVRFEDGTAFSLSANARMVIDELIYDPGGSPNSMTASVLSGTFAFVTGQIASAPDSEGMTVRTPVATIGIRGTTVSAEIEASALSGQQGGGRVTVLPDPGTETSGRVLVTTLGGAEELDQPYETTTLISFFEPPSLPFVIPVDQALALYGSVLPLLREIIGSQGEQQDGGEQRGSLDEGDLSQFAQALSDLEPGAGRQPGDSPDPTLPPPTYQVVEVDALVVQVAVQTLRALGRFDGRVEGRGDAVPGTQDAFTLAELEQVAVEAASLNRIGGTDGDDVLFGTDGNDLLDGAGGNDSVFGGAGDDLIVGSPGSDIVDGGPGIDRVVFPGARADYGFFLGDLLVVGPGDQRTLVKNVEELAFQDRTLTVPEAEAEAAPLAVAKAPAPTVAEGGTFTVSVTLTKAVATPLTVDYELQAGSASLPGDLDAGASSPLAGTLTFAPGETTKTLTYKTLQDTAVEPDETLTLVLTAPNGSQQLLLVEELGGALETQAATTLAKSLTIVNDDARPDTFVWTGGGDGSGFTDPANWQANLVPANGEAISIPAGASVTYPSGTIALSQATLNGRLDVNGGEFRIASATANAGTLAVATAAALVVEGGFSNAAGATLAGTGTVQATSIQNAGTVAPGQSAGTLTLAGPFVQTDSGRLEIEVGNAGSADRVTVQGTATLDGTLSLVGLAGTTQQTDDFHVLLSATGGISDGDARIGLFDSVTSDFEARVTLSPDATQLSLTVDTDGTVDGTSGADILVGSEAFDVLVGEAGDDLMFGFGNTDFMFGGDGNDRLVGGPGDDSLTGGDGDDLLEGGADDDRLSGGEGADALYGGDGTDRLYGGTGGDSLYGEDGVDSLYGGDGADSLFGGLGNDRLYGGDGVDLLEGGDGGDSLFGGAGGDSLYGGNGDDVLSATSTTSLGTVLTIDSGNYTTTDQGFRIVGQTVVGGELGPASLANVSQDSSGLGVIGDVGDTAGNVDNQIGYDIANGVSERLTVTFDDEAFSASVEITQLFLNHGETGVWTALNDGVQVGEEEFTTNNGAAAATIQIAPGSPFDELRFEARPATAPIGGTDSSEFQISQIEATVYQGSTFQNLLSGGLGNDSLYGGGGADSLLGGGGDDWLAGGGGADVLWGDGADVLAGDRGADTFYFARPADGTFVAGNGTPAGGVTADVIQDFAAGTDKLQFAADYGFGGSFEPGEFATLTQIYDGTNGSGTAYGNKQDALLVDSGGNVIHDANGSDPGYTVVARLADPATTVTDSDVQIAPVG